MTRLRPSPTALIPPPQTREQSAQRVAQTRQTVVLGYWRKAAMGPRAVCRSSASVDETRSATGRRCPRNCPLRSPLTDESESLKIFKFFGLCLRQRFLGDPRVGLKRVCRGAKTETHPVWLGGGQCVFAGVEGNSEQHCSDHWCALREYSRDQHRNGRRGAAQCSSRSSSERLRAFRDEKSAAS
jgi:hypothetical protein